MCLDHTSGGLKASTLALHRLQRRSSNALQRCMRWLAISSTPLCAVHIYAANLDVLGTLLASLQSIVTHLSVISPLLPAHPGSLMTGQPGAPTAAPTAAHPQVNPTAAGDEPSVQLLQDQQQALWFDASQQSFQGPNAARTAAGDGNAAAAAAEAQTGRASRLRKASYVNSPIYQHAGKRGPGSSLHQQQQEDEDKENAAAEVEQHKAPAEACGVQQQQQQGVAADTAAMQPPRKKVAAVRKPKKPAATALADGTPTRAGGRTR